MSTPQATSLDKIAARVQEAQEGAGRAFLLLQRLTVATTEEARRELAQTAQGQAKSALDATGAALEALQSVGARLPDRKGARPRPEPNPLAELVKQERSRPEALALLEALRAALPRAEDLDTVRGDVLAEPVNGLRGLVWGEELCQMIATLEIELYGPSERVTGGRE
jgi:hypothetical protein